MKFFYLFTVLLFISAYELSGREFITVDELTPVFAAPDASSKMIAVVRPGGKAELIDTVPSVSWSARHPLARYSSFYPVKLDRDEIFYLSPDIKCIPRNNNLLPRLESNFKPGIIRQILPWLFAAALAVISGVMFFKKIKPESSKFSVLLASAAAITRQLVLVLVINHFGNAVTCAADENGYFQIAMDICRGNFSGPWTFTIGLPLYYIPFIKLAGAENFYDIALMLDYFSGFIVAPAAIMGGFYLMRKLKISPLAAFTASMIWAIWPFVYYYGEDWNNLVFQAFFNLPGGVNRWRYYLLLISSGFNSMSDTPSMLTVIIAAAVIAASPAEKRFAAAAAAIFGFACLIRINNIFFAPALCLLAYWKYADQYEGKKCFVPMFSAAGVAAAVFLAIFSLQLAVNLHQFGNPFTFGYVLHAIDYPGPRPSDGFTWEMFTSWRHVKLLAGANFAVWAMGLTGIILLKDRRLRNFLTLWCVPVILFFYGYSHTFCDARRFIIATFPLMFAGFTALEGWRELSPRKLFVSAIVISAALLWYMPPGSNITLTPFLLPNGIWVNILQIILPASIVILAVYLFRTGCRMAAISLAVFGLLYFAGNAFIFAVLLFLSLLRSLLCWGTDIWARATGKTPRLPGL